MIFLLVYLDEFGFHGNVMRRLRTLNYTDNVQVNIGSSLQYASKPGKRELQQGLSMVCIFFTSVLRFYIFTRISFERQVFIF